MNKAIIISPSGNLYGSEKVLFDFLQTTTKQYKVFVKNKGLLFIKAKKETKHIIKAFKSEKWFYLKLFFYLIFNKPTKTIYVNEGGHIRYLKLFATIFKKRKFLVHIRIKEDTNKNRLGKLQQNIILITISQYMVSLLEPEYKPVFIYDPYKISEAVNKLHKAKENTFKIGIVGRLTKTKGLDNIFPILNGLQNIDEKKIIIDFWGTYNETDLWFQEFKNKLLKYTNIECNFKGFINNQEQIYTQSNLIIHLNTVEALGRIVFESVSYSTPIITFDKGGAGELMYKLKLDDLIINKEPNWQVNFTKKIIDVMSGKEFANQITRAKQKIIENFNAEDYTRQIEQLFQI